MITSEITLKAEMAKVPALTPGSPIFIVLKVPKRGARAQHGTRERIGPIHTLALLNARATTTTCGYWLGSPVTRQSIRYVCVLHKTTSRYRRYQRGNE